MSAPTDAPPSYARIIGDIEDIIKKLPDEAKEKALKAMKIEMEKSETSSALVAEVKRLADGASEISGLFDSVTLKLVKADAKKYKGVEELTPGWKDLRERFLDLFLQSRKAATDTNGYIQRYLSFIVPMILDKTVSQFTPQEKKEELEVFIRTGKAASMKDAQTTAMDFAKKFKKLAQDVDEYAVKFDDFAKTQKEAWDKRVTDLGREIRDLNTKLADYNAEILKWSIALGLTVGGAAIAAGTVLWAMGPLGPFVAAGILIAGLIAGGVEAAKLTEAVKGRDSTQDSIDDNQKELDDLQAKLKELKEIQAELSKAKADSGKICERLGGFESIWLGIANEAGIYMKFVEGGLDSPTYSGFREQIALSCAGYAALSNALTYYSKIQ